MNLYDLLEDYFVDSEDSVRTLITWFLNQAMEFEALQQSGKNMNEMIAEELKETTIENDH